MGDKVFYENGLFRVILISIKTVEPEEYIDAYGIVNKETGVREAETRRFFTARVWADGFADQHQHPEKYVSQPDVEATNNGPRMH